jgi:hypothetical protein
MSGSRLALLGADDEQSEPYTRLPTHIIRRGPKSDRSY